MVCRTSGDDMHERNDAMDRKEIVAAADAYWDAHRDAIVADIAKLVEIPSTEDLAAAAPRAPYGPGPAAALAAADWLWARAVCASVRSCWAWLCQ